MSTSSRQKQQQPSTPTNPSTTSTASDIPPIHTIAGDTTSPRLNTKICILTGVNSPLGIGRAAAHLFAAQGAKAIYLCDITTSYLQTHAQAITSSYPNCTAIPWPLDATDEVAVKRVCEDAVNKWGRLDVMFANAGVVGNTVYSQIGKEEFLRVTKGNMLSAFLCAKEGALAMQRVASKTEKTSDVESGSTSIVKEKMNPYATSSDPGLQPASHPDAKTSPSGSIILTASVAGLRSNAGDAAYSASKAGVVSIAQTLAYQLVGTNIRVNAIAPGIIETGMTQLMYEYARARGTEGKIGQLNPLRRGGVADEVARVAGWLAGDEGSYVNGVVVPVDGGLSAGMPFVPGKLA